MIAINARGFDDAISRWITEYAIEWFDRWIGQYVKTVCIGRSFGLFADDFCRLTLISFARIVGITLRKESSRLYL